MKRGKMTINENGVNITAENGTVWMSEYEIAQLFEVFVAKVSSNVRSILKSDVLRADEVYQSKMLMCIGTWQVLINH